jgi:hypothetical protein
MPNERNIEALTELLLEALPQPNVAAPALVVGVARAIAESLTSRGVIVPSSLTDDEGLKQALGPKSVTRTERLLAPALVLIRVSILPPL